ncbi:TIR domain-containing protein [Nonomuraea rubra]
MGIDAGRTRLTLHRNDGRRAEIWAALRSGKAMVESAFDVQVGDYLEYNEPDGRKQFLLVTGVRNFDSGADLSYSEMSLDRMSDIPNLEHGTTPGRTATPRVFVGSSSEGLAIAEYLQLGLEHSCECTLWNQGVFAPSDTPLQSLARAVGVFDYAVLILTPDDVTTKRNETGNAPRDNVMFELGLFIGAIGRDHTFIVCRRDHRLMMPSDLAGLVPLTFAERDNVEAALGPVCRRLKTAMGLP